MSQTTFVSASIIKDVKYVDAAKKIEHFFQKYPITVYQPKSTIIGPNNPNPPLFYIQQGIVKLYTLHPDGEHFMIGWIKPGMLFPLYQIFAEVHSRFYFEAATEVKLSRAPSAVFTEFLTKHTNCLFYLNKLILEKGSDISERIELFMISKVEDRVRFLLIHLAKTFGEEKNKKIIINYPISHSEMASWICSTRESVTRSLNELKKQKLINMDGQKIVINDFSLLEEKFL